MEIQAASLSEKAVLGMGYDRFKEEFVGRCVRGNTQHAGRQESFVTFDRSMEESSMQKQLGFDFGARARYGLFSGSAAAQFASESASSEYADVTIYSHIMNFQNQIFEYPGASEGLTEQGRVAKGSGIDDPFVSENWPLACGHEFVSQITLGAKLLLSVKIEFATREEKQSFSTEFSFQGPPVEVKASLQTAAKRYGKRASLSIQAFQLGGDVARLSSLFAAGGSGPAPIVVASLDNPDAVLALLDAVVRYSAEEFPHQVRMDREPNTPGGPAHLSYITSPYSELALFSPPPIIAASVSEARRLLSDVFEKNVKYQRRLSRLLNGPVRLSQRQQDQMKEMQRAVARNLALIMEAELVCYTDALNGPGKVAEVVEQLQDFVPEQFEVRPESFAQWYDMKDLPHTLRADQEVINEIVETYKGDFVDFEQIEDKGLALQRRLEGLESFFIWEGRRELFESPVWSMMGDTRISDFMIEENLSSLEPIRWLKHIKTLNIKAPVRDLSPLADLKELTSLLLRVHAESLAPLANLPQLAVLNIDDCHFRDLSPVATLHALRTFSADRNNISDVSSLAGLAQLQKVSLFENQIADLSPFATMPALENLGLSGNPIQSIAPLAGHATLKGVSFGSTTPPVTDYAVPDIKLLGQRLRFANLWLSEDRIAVSETIGWDSIWTRRGQSNVFDTVSRHRQTGEEVTGVAAITGINVGDSGLPNLQLFHERAGLFHQYWGEVTADRERVVGGMLLTQEGDSFVIRGDPTPEWNAQKA